MNNIKLIAFFKRYYNGIREGTDYVCVCCGGLFFRRSVEQWTDMNLKMDDNPVCQVKIKTDGHFWICRTCKDHVLILNHTPPLSLANNLAFPDIDPIILSLNETEERLCSPRIPFIRIMPLKWDQQKGLRGNVVNVPVDVTNTVEMLPRIYEDTSTIQVNLMRRMNYTKAYMCNIVNQYKVGQALRILKNSEIFVKLGIKIDRGLVRTMCEHKPNAFVEYMDSGQVDEEEDDDDDNDAGSSDEDSENEDGENLVQIHQTMITETIGKFAF